MEFHFKGYGDVAQMAGFDSVGDVTEIDVLAGLC
jgi:hypothetical protein